MYRTSDATCSTSDWVLLNFDAIPGGVFERLFADSPEDLQRVRPEPDTCLACHGEETCTVCEGSGKTPTGAECETCSGLRFCQACDGTGEAPRDDDDDDLNGWPAAHSTLWTCEDRPEYREALLASGFIVYTDESREGTFANCLIVGVDGGGYSFVGQHWIPLRARLAKDSAERFNESINAELTRTLITEAQHEGEARRVVDLVGDPMGLLS